MYIGGGMSQGYLWPRPNRSTTVAQEREREREKEREREGGRERVYTLLYTLVCIH